MLKRSIPVSALVATLAFGAACAVHNPDEPPVAGPSVLALSLVVTATPDAIYQDGGSQSSIVVTARDPNGKAMSGVTLRLDIAAGGTIQDFGSLSSRTVVTGADGRASAVYTAPPPQSPLAGGADVPVSILARTIGNNFQTAQVQSADIRLFPIGVILPPSGKPTALFSVTPTPVTQNVSATFDATASTPGSGATQITTYAWDFGDGATAAGVKAPHSFKGIGTFNVTLTVTDDRNRQASTTVPVSVVAGAPPTAKFVFSPTSPVVGQAVVFNADGSIAAPGHTIVQYSWIWGDGTPGDTSFVATHTFTTAGTYNVTLTVRDDADQKNTTSATVTVGSGNPTAIFTFSPGSPAPGATVTFDGSISTAAPGSSIVSYTWSFPGGTPGSSGPNSSPGATTTFPLPAGPFTVTLTVIDSLGRKGISFQIVTTK